MRQSNDMHLPIHPGFISLGAISAFGWYDVGRILMATTDWGQNLSTLAGAMISSGAVLGAAIIARKRGPKSKG